MKIAPILIIIILALILAGCHALTPVETSVPAETTVPVKTPAVQEPAVAEKQPLHECALLTQEDGAKLCGMPLTASNFTIVEYHDTKAVCKQEFAQDHQPYSRIVIEDTYYFSPENASKMFARDIKMKQGTAWQYNDSFFTQDKSRREIEFILDDHRIQVVDMDSACFDVESVAESAYKTLSSRLSE